MRERNHGARVLGCLLLACTTTAAALPARAQQPPQADLPQADMFLPEYFRDAAPATAEDMLKRVPGFTLVEADADVRGYAGAAGNVLLDGVRPTSKREDTGQQLQRIPASAVARIELIHAGAPGVDMGGYPVLANVVLRHEASSEGAIEAGVLASTDGWMAAQAALQYAWRRDDRRLELAFEQSPELDDDTGTGSILEQDAGAPEGTLLDWDTRTTKRDRLASVDWRQPFAAGQFALNAALRGEVARVDTAIGDPGRGERIGEDEDYRERELGARYGIDLGERTHLDAMATHQRARLEQSEVSREGDDSERFQAQADSGETIGRIDLTHARNEALSFDAWLEGASNFLHGESRLEENGVAVAVPGSSVRVEEQRAEASAGLTWRLRPGWSLDAAMRLERSTLSQTGDHARSRRFSYPKPRVALRWTPGEADDWRLAISREVGQLDFEDFVASASLEGGTVTAGNAELRPDQTWRSELRWEHRFNRDAALTATWTHDRIDDVVDRVLVVDGDEVFDAPGNIGDGRRDTLAVNLATPLDVWGLVGMRLRATALWRDSAVTDPVTGERRRISGEQPFEGEVELTQELRGLRLNWGVELEHIAERETGYRHDRITRESEGMGWTLFAESRVGERWRVRAELTDLFGRDFREARDDYAGTRASGILEQRTLRERRTPGTISVTIRRSTGG
jgi:hypothetical protein